MRWFATIAVALVTFAWTPVARAGDEEVLPPYLNSWIGIVIKVDLSQLDFDALHDLEKNALYAGTTDKRMWSHGTPLIDDMAKSSKEWLGGVRQAGGRQLYMVVNPIKVEPLVIVPIEPGVDREKLRRAMQMSDAPVPAQPKRFEEGAKIAGNVVVFGRFSWIDGAEKLPPTPRPELLKMLASAPAGSAQFAIEMTDDIRKFMLDNFTPQLPPELGGAKTVDLVAAFRGASGSVSFPPNGKIDLTVRGSSHQGAEAMKSLIVAGLNMMPDKPQPLIEFLTPQVEGNDLNLSRDAAAIEKKLAPTIVMTMVKAHDAAMLARSMMNLRMLSDGLQMYMNENGRYPDQMTMTTIGKYVGEEKTANEFFQNPRHPKLSEGYVYVRPKRQPTAETIVIYEKPDPDEPDDEVCVAFGDLRSEKLSRADFEKRMGK